MSQENLISSLFLVGRDTIWISKDFSWYLVLNVWLTCGEVSDCSLDGRVKKEAQTSSSRTECHGLSFDSISALQNTFLKTMLTCQTLFSEQKRHYSTSHSVTIFIRGWYSWNVCRRWLCFTYDWSAAAWSVISPVSRFDHVPCQTTANLDTGVNFHFLNITLSHTCNIATIIIAA